MLLRQWLEELGARSVERATLKDIKHFTFGEDAYTVEMQDGRVYQDNDLDRILTVIRDELNVHNNNVLLKGQGDRMHPAIEYPFSKGKQIMVVRPVVWTASVPPPELDLLLEQLQQNITYFNLTGQFTPPMKKDNL